MPNLVLCLDGTSNEFCRNNTNVVRLYQMLVHDPAKQVCFYAPGVGTFASPAALLPVSQRVTRVLGLAIGMGLMTTVEQAYRFLMEQWQPNDNIFLFGFSRGAYTARAVAAMLYRCGLLEAGQQHLVPYGSRLFASVTDENWTISREFADTFGRPCPVRFLGLWDTVSSVGWAWEPRSLPWTKKNPIVTAVRHAVAIDERRAFFRQNLWDEDEGDVQQVWFAGMHCDVGGSYPPARSGLSQIALAWMVSEAEGAGLLLDPAAREHILSTPPPDHRAPKSESLHGWWELAEYYPKQVRRKTTDATGNVEWQTTHRMNRGQPRRIAEGSCIHASVFDRIADVPTYRPTNLPQKYRGVG